MKLVRPLVIGAVLTGAFYWYTTHHSGVNPTDYISRPTHVELTEAAAPQTFDSEEQTNIEVYKRGIPSVVNITSTAVAFNFFYGPVPEEGQGSGFIIDKEGHILTNYHVIANAREVEVTLHNKKKYKATVIGRDRSHDLAVIQIKASDLVPATLGGKSYTIRFVKTFSDVPVGSPLFYIDSRGRLGLAVNQNSFAKGYGVHPPAVIIVDKKR